MKDKYMSVSEALKKYIVSGGTLRDRLIRGTISGFKIDDNEKSPWMVLIEDLDKNYKKKA
jgi:hypothetical protein